MLTDIPVQVSTGFCVIDFQVFNDVSGEMIGFVIETVVCVLQGRLHGKDNYYISTCLDGNATVLPFFNVPFFDFFSTLIGYENADTFRDVLKFVSDFKLHQINLVIVYVDMKFVSKHQ